MSEAAAHLCQLLDIGDASNRTAGSISNEGVNMVMAALRSGPPTATPEARTHSNRRTSSSASGRSLGSSR